MKDFRTRVTTVKAVRWVTDDIFKQIPTGVVGRLHDGRVYVTTPEGDRELRSGDWVVRDGTGAYFPMSDSAFQAKYEAAEIRVLSPVEI